MSEEAVEFDEYGGKIPVIDKRRFNTDGELVADAEPEKPAEPPRSAAKSALESQLKAEIERREAAEAKLVGVQAKFEEVKASLERDTADMRDRMKRSLEAKAAEAQFTFLSSLLPVLDNLNLAIESSLTDASIERLREGIVGTARSFEQALESVGVVAIASVGTKFDPELHEALDMAPAAPEDDGKVLTEYRRGYKFGDRLLRAARVQVGRSSGASQGE